jgi:hypothetical protein
MQYELLLCQTREKLAIVTLNRQISARVPPPSAMRLRHAWRAEADGVIGAAVITGRAGLLRRLRHR